MASEEAVRAAEIITGRTGSDTGIAMHTSLGKKTCLGVADIIDRLMRQPDRTLGVDPYAKLERIREAYGMNVWHDIVDWSVDMLTYIQQGHPIPQLTEPQLSMLLRMAAAYGNTKDCTFANTCMD